MEQKTVANVMRDEIQAASRLIAKTLHEKGEMQLEQLKQETKCDGHIIEWAIGWLVQEDMIEIEPNCGSFTFHRKEPDTSARVFI